ncbi:MAG: hypothetical protein R2713_19065 [Ilumatobacteraceae bacterium]
MAIETHQVSLHTADGLALVGDAPCPTRRWRRSRSAIRTHASAATASTPWSTPCTAGCRRGVATLRFDFRGVDGSEGVHDGGDAERIDAAAALAALGALTDAPIWLAGYSFGAAVALDTATPDLRGWLAVAPPLAAMPGLRRAAADDRPTHLLVAGHDQFSPPAPTAEATAGWLATTTSVLASADHFLAGHLDRVVAWAIDALGLDA